MSDLDGAGDPVGGRPGVELPVQLLEFELRFEFEDEDGFQAILGKAGSARECRDVEHRGSPLDHAGSSCRAGAGERQCSCHRGPKRRM